MGNGNGSVCACRRRKQTARRMSGSFSSVVDGTKGLEWEKDRDTRVSTWVPSGESDTGAGAPWPKISRILLGQKRLFLRYVRVSGWALSFGKVPWKVLRGPAFGIKNTRDSVRFAHVVACCNEKKSFQSRTSQWGLDTADGALSS